MPELSICHHITPENLEIELLVEFYGVYRLIIFHLDGGELLTSKALESTQIIQAYSRVWTSSCNCRVIPDSAEKSLTIIKLVHVLLNKF